MCVGTCGWCACAGTYTGSTEAGRATRLARAPEDQAPPAQVAASDTSPETRDTSATPPAPACPTRAQLPRPPEAGDRPVIAEPYAASARLVQAMGGPGPSPTRPSVGVSSTCLWPAMGGLSPSPPRPGIGGIRSGPAVAGRTPANGGPSRSARARHPGADIAAAAPPATGPAPPAATCVGNAGSSGEPANLVVPVR